MDKEQTESSNEVIMTDTDLGDESSEIDLTSEEQHEIDVNDIDDIEKEGIVEVFSKDEPDKKSNVNFGFGPNITDAIKEESPTLKKVVLLPSAKCYEMKDVEITAPTSSVKCSMRNKSQWKNPSKSEMHYYLSTLRLAVPNMSREQDQLKLRTWIFYLLRQVNDKTLRNRYLLLVTLSALSDECLDVIKDPPPQVQTSLPTLSSSFKVKPARWETDLYWDRLIDDTMQPVTSCPLHNNCTPNAGLEEGVIEAVGGHLMDQEFKYFLYLIRTCVSKLTKAEDKVRASMWIQKLGAIRPCACAFMKGLRNDYMQALLGYLSMGKCPGPFKRLPPEGNLLPLSSEANKTKMGLAELNGEAADEYFSFERPIENGAICYVAISGNPRNSKLIFSPLDVDFGTCDNK